eukprot:CAMPEP_0170525700 /NCGR_PEP_ID=MMETSP0209-20121228/11151_1 /TAXON_ID=665100 ORGANISM="Litonotus pictus, Strain P1" /NCGR_SAMPLE_ID=MMETSP0209 /ASSEMBLY_ACC=CAM_ASM_000301 /LENGTH=154 /DNA_ID=CAMNT_0010815085 /DNA_START=194 /DNA_END=658 /DNA_ORIENTATION=+
MNENGAELIENEDEGDKDFEEAAREIAEIFKKAIKDEELDLFDSEVENSFERHSRDSTFVTREIKNVKEYENRHRENRSDEEHQENDFMRIKNQLIKQVIGNSKEKLFSNAMHFIENLLNNIDSKEMKKIESLLSEKKFGKALQELVSYESEKN